jgi:predicted dehydrogenase
MIHDLDLVLWMVRSEVADVRAVGLAVLSNRVDIANARVEFHNGAVANFTASRVSTERVRKFRYFQPSEYISIDFARRDAIALSVDCNGPTPQIQFRKLHAPVDPVLSGHDGSSGPVDPLRAELAAFTDSVRTRQQPLVAGVEGRNALALAERVMTCIEAHSAQLHMPLSRPSGQSGEL